MSLDKMPATPPIAVVDFSSGDHSDPVAEDDSGSWSLISLTKRLLSLISGVLTVSGSAAAGQPPANPPLSVSGIDGAGNKQHLRTDTAGNQGVYGAATRSVASATIANGASVSGVIDLASTAILGFVTPAAWTAAALNFEFSLDGQTWFTTAYDSTGSQIGAFASFTVSSGYALDPLAFLPWRYVRLRSGTLASPVNQGADRVFSLITRPLA